MSIGFHYKKYYLVTSVTVNMKLNKDIITFITDPRNSSKRDFYEGVINDEVKMVERQTGAKFCHLYYKTAGIPYQFRFIFDMGVQDSNFKNKMKMKLPNRINQIFEDDSDYIVLLKKYYKNNEIYERDGYSIFMTKDKEKT